MKFDEMAVVISSFTEAGFLLGCYPLLFGLGIRAIIHIFKNI